MTSKDIENVGHGERRTAQILRDHGMTAKGVAEWMGVDVDYVKRLLHGYQPKNDGKSTAN